MALQIIHMPKRRPKPPQPPEQDEVMRNLMRLRDDYPDLYLTMGQVIVKLLHLQENRR
jgi:hypothetical protein